MAERTCRRSRRGGAERSPPAPPKVLCECLPVERTGVSWSNGAGHRRTGVVLRELLHLLGDFITGDQFDELERLVERRGDAAAGDAIAVDHEARIALRHLDRGVLLQTGDERPMRRGEVAVEEP